MNRTTPNFLHAYGNSKIVFPQRSPKAGNTPTILTSAIGQPSIDSMPPRGKLKLRVSTVFSRKYLDHAQDPFSSDIVVDRLGSEDHLYPRLGQRSHDALQRRKGEMGAEGFLVPPDMPHKVKGGEKSLEWRTLTRICG